MKTKETKARSIHKMGYNCSQSVYRAFSDISGNGSGAPAPRSDGGKCGAVLAALKILKEAGIEKSDEFEKRFLREFPSLKCSELLRSGIECNDFVGRAAGIVEELIGGLR
jgi:hypothetical protein